MNTYDDFFDKVKETTKIQLNEMQKQAVIHDKGAFLLLATPGSGKTTVLNVRIAFLIDVKGVNPDNILALTFSKDSALDMENRFIKNFETIVGKKMKFSTIHSFAYKIVNDFYSGANRKTLLAEYGSKKNGTVGKTDIIEDIYKKFNRESIEEGLRDDIISTIGYIKNRLTDINSFETTIPNFNKIYQEYESYKEENNYIDFDDMLVLCYKILLNNVDILKPYQVKYQYICTDESQDNSLVQNRIIELIAEPEQNVFCVGDDDQSLYGFRGADPEYLLNFKDVYKEAKILKMTQNYRSSEEIVDISNRFIKNNKKRYDKEMFTENKENSLPQVIKVSDKQEELDVVMNNLLSTDREEFNEIAVLFRNNNLSLELINKLDLEDIKYKTNERHDKFFNSFVVRDFVNALKLSQDIYNKEFFLNSANTLKMYLKKEDFVTLNKNYDSNKDAFENALDLMQKNDYRVACIKKAKKHIQRIKDETPYFAIQELRRIFKYDEGLRKLCDMKGISFESMRANADTLQSVSKSCRDISQLEERLDSFRANILEASTNKEADSISFLTFHACKGLEFDKVYMIGLIEGVTPTFESIMDEEPDLLEEERRMFYVGLSRAKSELILTSINNPTNKVKQSRFVKEVEFLLPSKKRKQVNLFELNPYDLVSTKTKKEVITSKKETKETKVTKEKELKKVTEIVRDLKLTHKKFGEGVVEDITGEVVTVFFETKGRKKLIKQVFQTSLVSF